MSTSVLQHALLRFKENVTLYVRLEVPLAVYYYHFEITPGSVLVQYHYLLVVSQSWSQKKKKKDPKKYGLSCCSAIPLFILHVPLSPIPVPSAKLLPMLSPPWLRPPCKAGDRLSCLGKPQQPSEHLLESKMPMVRKHKYFIEFIPCFHLNLPDMADSKSVRRRLSLV
jgi:hypothetical protein